jgi:NADH-quinone oxidoreductase subunit L
MFRLWYLTFHGKSRVEKDVAAHIHEAPPTMLVPMSILAVLSAIGGFIQIPGFPKLQEWLEPVFGQFVDGYFIPVAQNLDVNFEWGAFVILLALIAGAWLAARDLYRLGPRPKPTGALAPIYTFLAEKWYFDRLYELVIERPVYWLASVSWVWLDRKVIDSLVNGIARGVGDASNDLRPAESGYVRTYALALVVGVVLVVALAIGQR